MSGYAAMSSLKLIIRQLRRGVSNAPSVIEIMDFALYEVKSLQKVLEQVDDSSGSERVGALEGQIREAAYELEDSLEAQLLSQSEESLGDQSRTLSLNLQEVKQYVDSFTQKVQKIKEEYPDELTKKSSEEYDFGASSIAGFGGKMPKMVGLSDKLSHIKALLIDPDHGRRTVSILGIAGTGKTTLTHEIFEDPSILHHFNYRVWVTMGQKYNLEEIRNSFVAQGNYKKLRAERTDFSRHYNLDKRCLIVFDDVWDDNICNSLVNEILQNFDALRVLVNTRIPDLAYRMSSLGVQETRLMNEEESWDLLHEKMFGEELCPPELEKGGKEIAKNCEGYPPHIIKLAQLLSKSERIAECWTNVAETRNSIFMESYNEGFDSVSSTIDFHGKKPVIVGLSDDLNEIRNMLTDSSRPQLETVSLVGMAGIGKTTLAKEVFKDPSILRHFDVCVWITVGTEYQVKQILQGIVVQVNPGADIDIGTLDWHVYKSLKDRRYLIVLDDVWDREILIYLSTCCPDLQNGSRFLVTTELRDALSETRYPLSDVRFRVHETHLLNNEESWCLLRQKVFGEESCPFELEKAGKKIAEKCEGLPLAIVIVANLLSKEKKTPDYWNQTADEENSIFCDAYDQISDKIIRSYNHLPRYLKACFLYIGVFYKNYVISRSKLIRIWNAEGLMEQNAQGKGEYFAEKCLQELISRCVVIVCQQTSKGTTKTCKLHSVFWHMCNRTAEKNKLFHALSRRADGFVEGISSARRLSVRNSVLFRIKDVYNSMVSISTLRSLLCTSPPYQYSVQICSVWRLLGVLDAHTIRFYQFPIEAIELVCLRYFAITCNGKLPSSISKLWNLQYLIVHRHLGIKFSKDSSYLPVEIWEMRALKHLQVTGGNLPDPPDGAVLEDLLTLFDVSAHSCTRRVLDRIPNLENLGIQIELAPDAAAVPLSCFDISATHKVRSLKCVIMNPKIMVVEPPVSFLSVLRGLRKLTLCGFGYPWEYLSIINSLRFLEVLKLRSHAFCGSMHERLELQLWHLKLLVLEDIDLVHLNGISSRFPDLKRLIIRHCYKLKEIPLEIRSMRNIELIELVDCSPLAVHSAEYIRKLQKKHHNYRRLKVEIRIHSSWR